MATYNPGRGGWDDDDGNFINGSEGWGATNDLSSNYGRGSGSDGGGLGTSLLTASWGLLDLIPGLIANLVCFVIALLAKLGIVGRVILTAMAAIFTFFIMYGLLYEIILDLQLIGLEKALTCLSLTAAIIVAIWYWGYHKTIKQLLGPQMVEMLERCAHIVFYGFIVLALILGIFLNFDTPMFVPFFLVAGGGIYVWTLFQKAHVDVEVTSKLKKRVYITILGAGVALTIVLSVLGIALGWGKDTEIGKTWAAEAAAKAAEVAATVIVDYLEIRESPSDDALQIGGFYKNKVISVTGPTDNGWAPIKFEYYGRWVPGYVRTEGLEVQEPDAQ